MRAVHVEEWHSKSQGVPPGLDALVASALAADGHKPLDEHALAELKAGPQEMPHAAFIARDGDELVGYAHVSFRKTINGWRFEFVTHPSRRGEGIATMLAQHVLDHVARDGGGTLHTWAPEDQDLARQKLIERFGLKPIRRLLQQHAPLPAPVANSIKGITYRSFEESDAKSWLELHNVVFAEHPDAHDWTRSDLAWRMDSEWFDPSGFRLALDQEGIVAYNWMKIHDHEGASHDAHDTETRILGEIYMLGVAPRARGTGLAGAITSEGLHWASSRGATRAMLYVDISNEPAIKLYERYGFQTTHVDTCFSMSIPGSKGSIGSQT